MREVVKQYPDDLDAATLFAESGMNLHPWGLWHTDGTPEQNTEEIVATLESVIRRDPNHMGAIHYYIHAVEASRSPERALAGANRLAALAPAAGHLVHMPAHVYIRTGDYESAVKTNEKAAAADRAYIQSSGVQGIYPMMYYSHNLHFIAMCAAMNGNYEEAKKTAQQLAEHVAPGVKEMPPLEGFMTIPMAVEVRFRRWDDILATKQPPAEMPVMTLFWHFGRGMAFAAKGKVPEAEAEYKIVSDAQANTPEDAIFAMPVNNKTKDVLTIARDVLGAKIAIAKKDPNAAISLLKEAIATQDKLKYNEPPDWFYPVRETLGAVLLMNGDAEGAEKVFREDLDHNPRNPRSLYGLHADDEIRFLYGYFACFDAIAMGCCVAVLARWLKSRHITIGSRGRNLIQVAAGVFIAWIYLREAIGDSPVFGPSLVALGAAIFVLSEAIWRPGENSHPFRWEPTGWLGQRSYELYLFHIVVLALMRNIVDRGHLEPARKPIWFLVFLVASTAVAAAIARFYSEPLNQRLRSALGGLGPKASSQMTTALD